MSRTPARTSAASRARRRRTAGAVLAGALLAAPALTGCSKLTGFDVETDRPYVPNHGANYRVSSLDALVQVNGMVIVSAEDGRGTLVATFLNTSRDTMTTPQIEATEGVELVGYEPFELSGNEAVNLADETMEPITVSGDDVDAGASIPFEVGEGEDARTMWVPVVPDDDELTTEPRRDGHESGDGEEHEEAHDGAENPWAGLDRSADGVAGEAATVAPTTSGEPTTSATDDGSEG
ncbi:hypothetical protein INN71_02390 [Nocardioides sp. ChNu-153]|uniref:hypothetical protein n=1 Tax=unclassified Nocardioides TaxID=2615069 RepID=UPI0024066438|nr:MULTISPECIES: hypothetical protein [unclassified Nocardioides]MDF9716848.1 hypothetical protein [Nocardioides sp. ChNu-99]MDN7120234.1 hypothetical protein [Nocardioides sp. ChNu-153]